MSGSCFSRCFAVSSTRTRTEKGGVPSKFKVVHETKAFQGKIGESAVILVLLPTVDAEGSTIAKDQDLEAYLRDINEVGLLTAQDEKDLSYGIRRGDSKAREKMIRANLRLVVSIAKCYVNRGLSFMDLIEEGNLGLLKAVERFDPAANCRFSTYATWWIKQSIRRSLINSTKTVRIPSYMVDLISKWKVVTMELHHQMGRQPTIEEMAEAMNIPPTSMGLIKRAIRTSQTTGQAISLDTLESMDDFIEDREGKRPEDVLIARYEKEQVLGLIDQLGPREAAIMRMRYGLDNKDPMTLKQIGERVNLTRERIRQIENEVLRKLHALMTRDLQSA